MTVPYYLYLLIAVPSVCFLVSLYYNFKFAKIILTLEDGIEESLDIFDARYESMSKILDTPIFFDSLEVRQVVSDISVSRDSVLYVANLLASFGNREIERD